MKGKQSGELAVIAMRGCEQFAANVDSYLKDWRRHSSADEDTFILSADCPRFSSGEAKGILHESARSKDVYIICDVFNYGVTYKMYGMNVPMSPDDHYADLKRVIAAIGGKDSMSGTFEKLDVPPTLVSFAVTTDPISKVISPEFKKAGNKNGNY